MAQSRATNAAPLSSNGMVSATVVQLLHSEMVQLFVKSRKQPVPVLQAEEEGSFTALSAEANVHGSPRASVRLAQPNEQQGEVEAFHTLEALGHGVGMKLVDRLVHSKPLRILGEQAAMAFIAGEMWVVAFERRPDQLKIRRDGSYMLKDEEFRWLRPTNFKPSHSLPLLDKESMPQYTATGATSGAGHEGGTSTTSKGTTPAVGGLGSSGVGPNQHVFYSCGIVRGALEALGYPNARVQATLEGHCSVTYTIVTATNLSSQAPEGGF